MPDRVLIATSGADSTTTAVRIGCWYAEHRHLPVEAFAVIQPLPLEAETSASAIDTAANLIQESVVASVRAQLAVVAPARPVPIVTEVGIPGDAIAERANAVHAGLVVLGPEEHRLFGGKVALTVVRRARAPVLAVAPDAQVRMTGILIATDFGPASVRAARLALDLAADDSRVHIVHVGQTPANAFSDLKLEPPPRGTIETHRLDGDPARQIIAFAHEKGIDLIALGTKGKSRVAESVLRGAECSVLIAPPE